MEEWREGWEEGDIVEDEKGIRYRRERERERERESKRERVKEREKGRERLINENADTLRIYHNKSI